jgi:hypothetical protein
MEKPEAVSERGIIMRFIKRIFRKIIEFLRHLSQDYARLSFYVAGMSEIQRKKSKHVLRPEI